MLLNKTHTFTLDDAERICESVLNAIQSTLVVRLSNTFTGLGNEFFKASAELYRFTIPVLDLKIRFLKFLIIALCNRDSPIDGVYS